jgi:hypothetical protein
MMSMWDTIRGWFSPRCRYPGCRNRSPLFSQICDYHAGPDNENA